MLYLFLNICLCVSCNL